MINHPNRSKARIFRWEFTNGGFTLRDAKAAHTDNAEATVWPGKQSGFDWKVGVGRFDPSGVADTALNAGRAAMKHVQEKYAGKKLIFRAIELLAERR